MWLATVTSIPNRKGTREMPASDARSVVSVAFDAPNLLSCARLVPAVGLAQTRGLAGLATTTLTLRERAG
jgi:hypothetical protein